MTKGCHGTLRTPKGDRILVALATDRSDPELVAFMLEARKSSEILNAKTDEQLMELIEKMISSVPKKCPECDGTND